PPCPPGRGHLDRAAQRVCGCWRVLHRVLLPTGRAGRHRGRSTVANPRAGLGSDQELTRSVLPIPSPSGSCRSIGTIGTRNARARWLPERGWSLSAAVPATAVLF